jgi:hypothetical protein
MAKVYLIILLRNPTDVEGKSKVSLWHILHTNCKMRDLISADLCVPRQHSIRTKLLFHNLLTEIPE